MSPADREKGKGSNTLGTRAGKGDNPVLLLCVGEAKSQADIKYSILIIRQQILAIKY